MLRQISNLIGSKILCQNKPTTATRAAVAQWTRPLSSQQTPSTTTNATTSKSVAPGTTIVDTEDGRTFAALFDTRKQPKLKPSIVRKRLEKMRTYAGAEKNIRHSPWRINLICQMVAGLPLQEALRQLEFCEKSKAPLVQKVLRRTAKLADVRDGLQLSQLEVAECFSTKGTPLKRIKPMARGRFGKMTREHSHMRVVLREIDFKLRIYQANTVYQKKKWLQMQMIADADAEVAMAERREVQRLEEEQRKLKKKQEEEAKK